MRDILYWVRFYGYFFIAGVILTPPVLWAAGR